jgi:hypothetical protein
MIPMSPSKEINDAVGEGPARSAGSKNAAQVLTEKRAALVAAKGKYQIAKEARDEEMMGSEMGRIDALNAIIRELEQEVAVAREQEGVQRAKARVLAIKRGIGSVVTALDEDENKLTDLLDEIVTRLNDRYEQTTTMRAEALALTDRFDLPKPSLPDVVSPARRAIAAALVLSMNKLRADAGTWEANEQCEHKMRTRRNYAEAEGTPGGEIIEAAGLKPFPELTDSQRAILTAKAREQEELRRQFAGLPSSPVSSF